MTYQRKEVIGNATLYLGDCLEILPTLDKVDAVITDPPFNAGKNFQNDSMADKEWRYFCRSIAKTINADNILIEVGKNDVAMRSEMDFIHRYRWAITLNYTNAMRQGAVGYSNTGLVMWYGEGKCHKRFMDRIDAPIENTKHDFSHPSPKTTAHYQRLVDMFTLSKSIVSDPFMGSGTTGVACMNLGRKFIGIEIEPKYFDIACERIENAQRQQRLFV
ncbi:MAG: site-specific DNA-methyltransferase [Kiritimatiellaceae bacterium]|nr:site-specific DNA-methyltransferase [Kiritimatiellaceae bacterium]